jgi:unspecific monooxygenase
VTGAAGPAPADLGYVPADPTFVADPYPAFARLRADAPVAYDPATDQWLVSRFADVDALLRDRRLGRTYLHVASPAEWGRSEPPAWQDPFWHLQRHQLIDMEPPDHTRLRRLVLTAFTPRTVARQRPRIQAIVDGLIERARDMGEFDLLGDLIEDLPVTVIADMLGITEADRGRLRPWSADITLMFELGIPEAQQRRAVAASAEFTAYMVDLVRERRAGPGEDLLSDLIRVAETGDSLTDDEVVATAILLLNAGHEASVNGAGNAWWALFRHPASLARLRAEPDLAATAGEELLRFDTPAPMFERWVLEDIEVAGVTIPRGQELALLFASADRDETAFDRADEIVLDRRPNPHVAFGAGIHFCLGAPLARLELEILYRSIVERLPTLELVREPRWKPRFVLRGLESLPVRIA